MKGFRGFCFTNHIVTTVYDRARNMTYFTYVFKNIVSSKKHLLDKK